MMNGTMTVVDPLAALLHELNTPLGVALTAISIQAERLDEFACRPSAEGGSDLDRVMKDLRESTQLARKGLDRAIAILGVHRDTLSAPSRAMDESRAPGSADLLSLEVVLGDALSVPMVRFSDRIHECTLEVEHDLQVQTDPNAWYQVITNLVANSMLHGFDGRTTGGCITLSAERVGVDRVRVRYRDDGCGFSDRARADAFTRRYSSRFESGSSGLGLCIVRDIVRDRLHGTIELLDEPGGAAFDIEIPILVPSPVNQPE